MQEAQPTNAFTFQFKNSTNHEIRTLQKEDGSVWFVAKDVCDTLGYGTVTDPLRKIPNNHKGTNSINTSGGTQQLSIINEPGLYRLVLRSNKPEAEPFIEWVSSEVLPTIRKTGSYAMKQALTPTTTTLPVTTSKEAIAFLQVATDAYWHTNTALSRLSTAMEDLRKNRKAVAAIVGSIKEVFPDTRDVFDEIQSNSRDTADSFRLPLEVEKR